MSQIFVTKPAKPARPRARDYVPFAAVWAMIVACQSSSTFSPDAASKDAAADVPPAADANACGVDPAAPRPERVVFRVRNTGAAAVYLHGGCVTDYRVSSCASGFTDTLGPEFRCACRCDEPSCTGQVACGPCQEAHGVLIAGGEHRDFEWSPFHLTTEQRNGSPPFSCVRSQALPVGTYRFTVPVYASEPAASVKQDPRLVTVDFRLTGPGPQLVEADVTPPGPAPSTTFKLVNETGRPIYIQESDFSHQGYWSLLRDGATLPVTDTCEVCNCATCPACAVCGRALATVKEIAAGATHEFSWSGSLWPQIANGCRAGLACEQEQAAGAGTYELAVTYSFSHATDDQFGGPDDFIGIPVTVKQAFQHPTGAQVVVRAR